MSIEKPKRSGPKTRSAPVGLLRHYGSGHINVSMLDAEIGRSKGDLELFIVREQRVVGEWDLSYGVFYKTREGEYFDVVKPRDAALKTFQSGTAAATFIASYGANHGDRFLSSNVPGKVEANVIGFGDLISDRHRSRSKE